MKKKILFVITALYSFVLFGQPIPELIWYKFQSSGISVPNHASMAGKSTPANADIMGSITQGGTAICGSGLIGSGNSANSDYLNTNWSTNLSSAKGWSICWRSSGISSNSTLYYIFGDASAGSFRCFTNGVAGSNNWILRGSGMNDVIMNNGALNSPTTCAYVYDPIAGNIKAYLNGSLVNTVSQSTSLNITGSTPFKVMGYGSSVGAPFGGVLDDFRIYDRPLSATEIEAIYNPYTTGGFLGEDTSICHPDSLRIGVSGYEGATYNWSTSANTDSIFVKKTGTYVLDITGNCGAGKDSITIRSIPKLATNFLGPDPSICVGSTMKVGISVSMDSIRWSTGSTADSINITGGKTYTVIAYNSCGAYMDTITGIDVSPLSNAFLGADVTICTGDTAILTIGSPVDSLLWSTGSVADTLRTTRLGKYSVEAWNVCNKYYDTIELLASSIVYKDFILPVNGVYCAGDTISIATDSNFTSYLWSNGDTTQKTKVYQSGTYTLSVADGCGAGKDTIVMIFGKIPTAAFMYQTKADSIVDFKDATTGTGPLTYSWNFGDGQSTSTMASPSHTYNKAGDYFVTLIVSGPCGADTLTDRITITNTALDLKLSTIKDLKVFPNPVSDVVNIQGTLNNIEYAVVTIESIFGEQLIRREVSSKNGLFTDSIELVNLSPGIYFLKCIYGDNMVATKLMVRR